MRRQIARLEKWLQDQELHTKRWFKHAKYTWAQFGKDECFQSAGMLTYATLLSLVPLLIVVVTFVSTLPGADGWDDRLQGFILENFLPSVQQTVREYLESFIASRGRLTATMGMFLLVTSVLLMANVERAMNRIWGVQTNRSWANRFVVYWSVLTLGPIFLGASLALSSYFFSLDFVSRLQQNELVSGISNTGLFKQALQFVSPFLVGAVAFFLIFMVVPNRKVPLKHALIGASLTSLLFESAKAGFGLYARSATAYNEIYSTLGVIPVFLVWIYVSWTVILLGASFTASLERFNREQHRVGWRRRRVFVLLYRLVQHLWNAQRQGRGLDVQDFMRLEPEADDHQVQELLENLRVANIVKRDEEGVWLLVRDLASLKLGDLYATGFYAWPRARDEVLPKRECPEPLKDRLDIAADSLEKALDVPLRDLYLSDHSEPVSQLKEA